MIVEQGSYPTDYILKMFSESITGIFRMSCVGSI